MKGEELFLALQHASLTHHESIEKALSKTNRASPVHATRDKDSDRHLVKYVGSCLRDLVENGKTLLSTSRKEKNKRNQRQ